MIDVPAGLADRRRLGEDWAAWLDRLPALTSTLLAEWSLRPDGDPLHGFCSLVLPVRGPDGPAALKVSFDGDDESALEHLALRRWDGTGAVRLLRADPRRRALLLERIGPHDLGDAWDVEACEVVAGLYAGVHVPALPQLTTLASVVERDDARLGDLPRDAPLPRRLVEQARSLTPDLLAPGGEDPVLLHGDLHYGNVLAGRSEAEPWLVIDPKPLAGDRHYEPAPMLWNRMDELGGSAYDSVRDGLRRRFHTLVDVGGLDEHRARDWVVVRMVHNALWTIDDARAQDRALERGERDWITRCVTVAKAVQD
ncbi:aminoglycoside phosphotransferase family protein [uncultured Nocardioides sp.]|uniref:aminoglycoside phosphotransferase family protein n=1 Tax=uncultured Nocardioides sp. TaxID=198441 RepID=UPI00261B7C37|nr:aminoglycoside phosphotransferase family protein [uncultured Nocardioides sp.]